MQDKTQAEKQIKRVCFRGARTIKNAGLHVQHSVMQQFNRADTSTPLATGILYHLFIAMSQMAQATVDDRRCWHTSTFHISFQRCCLPCTQWAIGLFASPTRCIVDLLGGTRCAWLSWVSPTHGNYYAVTMQNHRTTGEDIAGQPCAQKSTMCSLQRDFSFFHSCAKCARLSDIRRFRSTVEHNCQLHLRHAISFRTKANPLLSTDEQRQDFIALEVGQEFWQVEIVAGP